MNRKHPLLFNDLHFLRVLICLVVVGFFSLPVLSQDIQKDSLLQLLNVNKQPDSLRLAVLIDLAAYHKNQQPDTSKAYIDAGLVLAEENGLEYQKATLKQLLVQYYGLQGNYEGAVTNGLEAVSIYDSLGATQQQLVAHSELIPVLSAAGYNDKALELSLSSLALVQDEPETPSKARYYFTVGTSYRNLSRFEDALPYYAKALTLSKTGNFKPGIAVISVNIALTQIALNNLEEARELLNAQLKYFRETNNKNLLSTTVESLGDIAAKQFNHRLAVSYYEDAIVLLTDLKFLARIQDVSMKLFVQYSLAGEPSKAEQAEIRYKHLRDSLENERIAKIVGDLQTKYETEQKESEIEALHQQSEIQALEIRQRNQVIYFVVITFLFILLTTFIIYRQRSIAKKRKQVELEQRFLRSQLNPHFISNALVAVQSYLLENNTDLAVSYLSKYTRLMREILENSRKEFISVEDELMMLNDYLEINRLRLSDSFTYEIIVDEAIDEEEDMIPPMFIQPFVENAIEHGLSPEKHGNIWIELKKVNSTIQVTIKDNGGGLDLISEKQSDKQSLSTSIIQERMQLFNRSLVNKIELLMKNWPGESGEVGGTLVELQIPTR